jgi:5-methylcytosine-specific restriction endonuclease McrA
MPVPVLVPAAAPTAGGYALVLNATYEPLCVVPQRRALLLVLADKAMAVEDADAVLHSASRTVHLPLVIRLMHYVRVPYRGHVPLTRRALFVRDGGRCAYCDRPASTVDHVVPRSRGGRHEWENVVSACSRCNHVKADRVITELGWRMRIVPHTPSGAAWRILGTGRANPRWAPYLEAYGGDVLEATG